VQVRGFDGRSSGCLSQRRWINFFHRPRTSRCPSYSLVARFEHRETELPTPHGMRVGQLDA
jgi:hypothetical protein